MSQFRYLAPQTKQKALEILGEGRAGVHIVAGGTNVIPDMRTKKISGGFLLDISNLKELSYIAEDEHSVLVGAVTTIAEIAGSDVVRKSAGILFQACNQMAGPLIRNRATIGGNLADASPAADTAVPLLALEAILRLESIYGEREIPIREFFVGPNATVLKEYELISAIEFKKSPINADGSFIKLGLRKAMAVSVASVALTLEKRGSKLYDIRIALGSVAPKPIRATTVEQFLIMKDLTDELVEEAARKVSETVSPISDIRASADYRRHVAGVLFKRALRQTLSA
ncbi:MAG: xanthine dehydrogenase family protein subunit M [Chloroflexi bacterium]|nr:xanthine dehydrogenase family protein subunit M [Chloroflexota bacterium]